MEVEEQRKGAEEILYKTKVVQFLGRATPIVLQNDNGPCPLLAICKPFPLPLRFLRKRSNAALL
ncbi:hypothetical protein C4D60_Mb09t20940 [Musa balbisiana]|uniref:MINDY deubiquitinase domain-containing protein n=1 Tax=Musa balbisiana TaxID=52838 RepID=A0A4S8IHW8_MUSBA|nr:hypothetical protein C4D60_Mb09t20940 [Musa balbisiana]